MNSIVKKLLKQKHKEYKKKKKYMLSGDIEYYTFTYTYYIPIYKTPPVPDYHKHYCFHKDEIIVDLDKENKKLKNIIEEVREYINQLLEYKKDKKVSLEYVERIIDIINQDKRY